MAAEYVHDPGLALMKSGWRRAMVPVVEIDAGRIPRHLKTPITKTPITVEDLLNPRMIAYAFLKWPAA